MTSVAKHQVTPEGPWMGAGDTAATQQALPGDDSFFLSFF